ncbi:DUF2062 domain-containing protein, partial [Escherichia coli]|uniref:DUF2062 domain-containing protein n=1 Tax=Escherichia coli TaxID=562 RepID=UPI00190DF2D4
PPKTVTLRSPTGGTLAAAFALPLRANIPAAAATTFITNPATTPIVWVIAYKIGRWLRALERGDPMPFAHDASYTSPAEGLFR